MRYAVRCSYDGSDYFGWQSQKSKNTVQDVIEEKLFQRLRENVSVTGCCRTDSGVHASDFLFHFDTDIPLEKDILYSINKMLPINIALIKLYEVKDDFHSRFDAVSRAYKYYIHTEKNPFKNDYSFYFPQFSQVDIDSLNALANELMTFDDFVTFSKSKSDVKTTICDIKNIFWEYDVSDNSYIFNIRSDRFLRGMVRLLVGMFINYGLGKISKTEIINTIKNKEFLKLNWSVPAQGLFLNEVKYLTLD